MEAFRSTLEETVDAGLLVHVVDGSDADPLGQIDAVRTVLAEIGASDRPEQLVINKIDQADPDVLGWRRRTIEIPTALGPYTVDVRGPAPQIDAASDSVAAEVQPNRGAP